MAMPISDPQTLVVWGVADMERQSSDGCVTTVHWVADATDGTYSAHAYGSIGLEPPEGELIPFEDLSVEIVVGWIKQKLGEDVDATESSLVAQVAYRRAPKTVTGLPWVEADIAPITE